MEQPMKRICTFIVIACGMTVLPGWGCDESLTLDPSFDLWCGNELCSWTVEQGDVQRVPTWHRSDFGVELVGDPVVLSQVSEKQADCFHFRVQADVEPGVSLKLEMDFLDDGKVDFSQHLPSDNWIPSEYDVTPPAWYDKVRFVIRKSGAGRAVVSTIRVTRGDACSGPPILLLDRPDGAKCSAASECRSSDCQLVEQWHPELGGSKVRACSSCASDADCAGSKVCGLEGRTDWLYKGCVDPGAHVLGERCVGDGECDSGVCCEGVCSECCNDGRACAAAGAPCKQREWWTFDSELKDQYLPWQCSPGAGIGETGARCLLDDDCASGRCVAAGELRQCYLDSRLCEQDDECPIWKKCLTIGAYGGRCQ